MSPQEIFDDRKNKFLRIGRSKGFMSNLNELSSLNSEKSNFNQFLKSKKIFIAGLSLTIICCRINSLLFIKLHSIVYISYQTHTGKVRFYLFFYQMLFYNSLFFSSLSAFLVCD